MNKVFANIADNACWEAGRPNIIICILSADLTGETFSVKVGFEYPNAILGAEKRELQQTTSGTKQTEYLSLIKFKGGWQIVSKVFLAQSTNALIQQTLPLKK